MSSVERVVKDYRKAIGELERNDKVKINFLTILAEDFAQHDTEVAKVLETSIFEVIFHSALDFPLITHILGDESCAEAHSTVHPRFDRQERYGRQLRGNLF